MLKPYLISRAPPRHAAGFTLVELIIVLIIATIFTMVAVPAFRSTITKYRLEGEKRGLRDTLQLAHVESAGTTALTVCASSDGRSCTAGKEWHIGHIMFSDEGTIGTVDGSDEVLARVLPSREGYTTLAVENATSQAFTRGYIHFEQGKPDLKKALRFTVCHKQAEKQEIFINMYGHIWSAKGTTPCE